MMLPFSAIRSPLWEKARPSGFTLIELLVAMAVLSLILVLLLGVIAQINQSTRLQNQQMESVGSARRALDVMAADLQASVRDGTANLLLPTSRTTNVIAMVTERRGPEGISDHRLLAVRYTWNDRAELWRGYGSVAFRARNLFEAAAQARPQGNAPRPLAEGILGLKIFAVTSATNTPDQLIARDIRDAVRTDEYWATSDYGQAPSLPALPSGYKALVTAGLPLLTSDQRNGSTRSLEIWMAAVDSQTMALMEGMGRGDTARLQSLLESVDPREWRNRVDSDSALPAGVKTSLQILTRKVPLP